MMSHPPIPIHELAEHIELLKANDNLRLSQEYEVSISYCFVVGEQVTLLHSLLNQRCNPAQSFQLLELSHAHHPGG